MPVQGKFPGTESHGSWDISNYIPTRGSENFPYYFTPLGKTYTDFTREKQTQDIMLDATITEALREYRSDPEKYANTSMEMYDINYRYWTFRGFWNEFSSRFFIFITA